jgi:signal transduction histidine kinase
VLAELFRNAKNLVADDPELELLEEDGDVLVCDRGPGLKAEDCERIFKPFEQIHERTGVGMGLATVKRAMAMMDGEIAAEPREGGGACFRLTFG